MLLFTVESLQYSVGFWASIIEHETQLSHSATRIKEKAFAYLHNYHVIRKGYNISVWVCSNTILVRTRFNLDLMSDFWSSSLPLLSTNFFQFRQALLPHFQLLFASYTNFWRSSGNSSPLKFLAEPCIFTFLIVLRDL